jgi:hypothetical protein
VSVYCTTSYSACSRRRTKMPIIYPDLRLDYKVATHPYLLRPVSTSGKTDWSKPSGCCLIPVARPTKLYQSAFASCFKEIQLAKAGLYMRRTISRPDGIELAKSLWSVAILLLAFSPGSCRDLLRYVHSPPAADPNCPSARVAFSSYSFWLFSTALRFSRKFLKSSCLPIYVLPWTPRVT